MKEAAGKCVRSWSIAWICCFINFLLLGVSRLSGLLYLASIYRYGVDRSRASLPFVLCYAVRNISGPLIGYVGRRVEIRFLVACGCFLSALGAGACFFAEDITTVTVLWGGVHGLGFGLGTILLPQILNQHFEKYISIANGIAFGGECVAGFLLPVIVELFLDSYGTSGTFLILSGLILHGVPAALLLKSPKSISKQSDGNRINHAKEKNEYDSVECVYNEGCYCESHHSSICNVVNCQEKCSKHAFKNTHELNYSKRALDLDNLLDISPYPKNHEPLKNRSYYQCSGDKLDSIVSNATESNLVRRTSKYSSCCNSDNETGTILGDTVYHDINFEKIGNSDNGKSSIVSQTDSTNLVRRHHSTSSSHSTNYFHPNSIIHSESSARQQSSQVQITSQHSANCLFSLEEDTCFGHSSDGIHHENPTTIKSNDIIHCENQTLGQPIVGIHFENRTTRPSNDGIYCENQKLKQSNDGIHCKNPTAKQSNDGTHCENTTVQQSNDGIHCENQSIKQSNDGIHCENQSIRQSNDGIHCENAAIRQSNQESDATKRSSFYAFRVFLDPPFILILLTQSSMIFIFTTVMTVIVDFSRDAGVSGHQEVYVLMCLSVSDMIGRFGLGWVTDLRYMSNIAFSAVCYAGTGILMVALVYLRGFPLTMTVAFFIGLFLGGLLIVGPGIIMDYIEEDKVTMALASRFVLFAPMSLTQSSLIGFFREKLGSYSGLFCILGFNSFLCCLFSLLVPCASRWRSHPTASNSKTLSI